MKKKKPTITLKPREAPPAARRTRTMASAEAKKEVKLYGLNACRAVWQHRPQDIVRVYVLNSRIPVMTDILKWAAQQRIAYHVVEEEDLARLTQSEHHEGVCILAVERPGVDFSQLLGTLKAKENEPQLLLFVDGVENPHNLGALVRTCAHFGVRYVLGDAKRLPRMSAAATRVAEGGAESVDLVYLNRVPDSIKDLKKIGFQVFVTSARDGTALFNAKLPRRSIFVLGAESIGVSLPVQDLADKTLSIPGTGNVESLNVSAAFAVLAGEFSRQQPTQN